MRKRWLDLYPVELAFLILIALRQHVDDDKFVLLAPGAGEEHLDDTVVGAHPFASVFCARVHGQCQCTIKPMVPTSMVPMTAIPMMIAQLSEPPLLTPSPLSSRDFTSFNCVVRADMAV
jgi:hypothetical protein